MNNPYEPPDSQTPDSVSPDGYLRHRRCPCCGNSVPWTRLWLRGWVWAKWPCRNCGVTLTFSGRRRLAVAVLWTALSSTTYVVTGYLGFFPRSGYQVALYVITVQTLLMFPAFLVDGVVPAEDQSQSTEM